MDQVIDQKPAPFVERRLARTSDTPSGRERRQFSDAHGSARPEVTELAQAIDRYKLTHHRRFITFEELYDVIAGLGYHR